MMNPKGDPQKMREVCTRCHVFPLSGAKNKPQTFHHVAVVWKHSAHPNIVPLLGVTVDPLQLISAWMPGGNLMEHIKSHPDADRLTLVNIPSLVLCDKLTLSSVV